MKFFVEEEEEIPESGTGASAAAGAAGEAPKGPGAAAASSGSGVGAAKRPRTERGAAVPRTAARDRVLHDVPTDAGWEAYVRGKFRLQGDWIATVNHDTARFRNKVAYLHDLIAGGIEEATGRNDSAKVRLWQAELELGRSATPFISSVD